MSSICQSDAPHPDDARMGVISRELEDDKKELQDLKKKLKCKSNEFKDFANAVDPDTGRFHKNTNDSVIAKFIQESPHGKFTNFHVPCGACELAHRFMKLERDIDSKEKEWQDLSNQFKRRTRS